MKDNLAAAIASHLAAVPRLGTIQAQYENLRGIFGTAYTFTVDLAVASARDREEYCNTLRPSGPLEAADRLIAIFSRETWLPPGIADGYGRVLKLFIHRNGGAATRPMDESEHNLTPVLIWLENDVARMASTFEGRWQEKGTTEDAQRSRSAARIERLAGFKAEWTYRGKTVSDGAVARSAGVAGSDFRRWKTGKLSDDSVMSARIENVLAGREPMIEKRPLSQAGPPVQ